MRAFPFRQVQGYQPLGFQERGVAVPFTTPVLVGTRARPAPRRGVELLVPNPSGGRGVYVLPWDQACTLCRPTVHDQRLNERLRRLISVTPSSIRQAARDVAAEGLAGREARLAALAAVAADRQDRLMLAFLLLVLLHEQGEPAGREIGRFSDPQPEIEQAARRFAVSVAPRLGLVPEAIVTDLEQLAIVFLAVGLEGQVQVARVPALLARLARLHEETTTWGQAQHDRGGELALMVGEVAEVTVAMAASTLCAARAATADLPALLRLWAVQPERVKRLAARPEWLLDGWEQICLLWEDAETPAARPAAVAEMVALVPALPRETCDWVGIAIDHGEAAGHRRTVQRNQDWRTGAIVFDLVSRNERFRARSP